MPRRGALPRQRSLRLGEPKAMFSKFFGLLRRSNASPKRTSLPRHSIASLKRTCKPCFGSSLPLILTIIHWINEDPKK